MEEAKYRSLCASKAGEESSETRQADVQPDVTLRPDDELWSPVESDSGLGMPVGYYAIMDSALRARQGLTPGPAPRPDGIYVCPFQRDCGR